MEPAWYHLTVPPIDFIAREKAVNNSMSKAELELRVIDFIHEHDLFSPGEAVVIGVSGGPD